MSQPWCSCRAGMGWGDVVHIWPHHVQQQLAARRDFRLGERVGNGCWERLGTERGMGQVHRRLAAFPCLPQARETGETGAGCAWGLPEPLALQPLLPARIAAKPSTCPSPSQAASHREKGKAPGELSEKPSESLALLISASRFTRCSGHRKSVSSLWPLRQSISNSTSHGAAHPGCPPAPEMSSGRQMPNDA